MSLRGKISRVVAHKGFGWIEHEEIGEVFVHFRQLLNGYPVDMKVGLEMSFDLTKDAKTGKNRAENVRIVKGGDKSASGDAGANEGEGEGSTNSGEGWSNYGASQGDA